MELPEAVQGGAAGRLRPRRAADAAARLLPAHLPPPAERPAEAEAGAPCGGGGGKESGRLGRRLHLGWARKLEGGAARAGVGTLFTRCAYGRLGYDDSDTMTRMRWRNPDIEVRAVAVGAGLGGSRRPVRVGGPSPSSAEHGPGRASNPGPGRVGGLAGRVGTLR